MQVTVMSVSGISGSRSESRWYSARISGVSFSPVTNTLIHEPGCDLVA